MHTEVDLNGMPIGNLEMEKNGNDDVMMVRYEDECFTKKMSDDVSMTYADRQAVMDFVGDKVQRCLTYE